MKNKQKIKVIRGKGSDLFRFQKLIDAYKALVVLCGQKSFMIRFIARDSMGHDRTIILDISHNNKRPSTLIDYQDNIKLGQNFINAYINAAEANSTQHFAVAFGNNSMITIEASEL